MATKEEIKMSAQAGLVEIQEALKVPKNQFNSFGQYKYRSCEDILEAVKPLLRKRGMYIVFKDEVEVIGDRFYVRATVTVSSVDGSSISTSALAREDLTKKGMDGAQITGAASSYARKYALSGLFAIDDSVDNDSINHEDVEPVPAANKTKKSAEQISLENEFSKLCKDNNLNGGAIFKTYKLSVKTVTVDQLQTLINGLSGMLADPKAKNELPADWRL